MSEKTQQRIVGIDQVPTTRAANFHTVYVNTTKLSMTPWDINLVLGRVGTTVDGVTNEEQLSIYVSPQQAKALSSLLRKAVLDYETQYGMIAIPGALLEPETK